MKIYEKKKKMNIDSFFYAFLLTLTTHSIFYVDIGYFRFLLSPLMSRFLVYGLIFVEIP